MKTPTVCECGLPLENKRVLVKAEILEAEDQSLVGKTVQLGLSHKLMNAIKETLRQQEKSNAKD